MTDLEKELERALAGRSHAEDVHPLAETAEHLRSAFAVDVPEARAESLLFTNAVGLRKRSPLLVRIMIPVFAVASILVALVLVSRNAVPGDSFYPVRGALKKVGLASAPVKEADREIRAATNLLIRAETALSADPDRAEDLAHDAIDHLGEAWDLVEDLDGGDRARRGSEIRALEQRASAVIVQADVVEDRLDRQGDDDRSGPGSGDGGDDDNSGPGSDDGDDNSGSGSSRSDDGGSDDDSSGSGSGGSGSGDDSGSGSSGSGSGDDDNSGSG